MGSSFHNLDWNSLKEVSNNLGNNGNVGTPTNHSSNDDFVTATMLELVRRHLEEVQTEQIRTVKVALGAEREERTVNDNGLKTCIEKLMTEMVRLNAQFKEMQQRIGDVEKWKDSPPTAAVDQQREMPQNGMPVLSPEEPFPPANSSREETSTNWQVKAEGRGQELQIGSPSDDPMTTEADSPDSGHQRPEPLAQHRSFQLCNVGRILSSGFFQSQVLEENEIIVDISSHPDPVLPVPGDLGSNPIASPATPTSASNLSQEERGMVSYSKSGAFIIHEMASNPGGFPPVLCSGLEFDSDSGLSRHVIEQDLHKNVPTSQCSISIQIPGPLKRTSLRQQMNRQKMPTTSTLEPVGEQALINSAEMPSSSMSTTPSGQLKIGKPTRRAHGDVQAHEKDPILPKSRKSENISKQPMSQTLMKQGKPIPRTKKVTRHGKVPSNPLLCKCGVTGRDEAALYQHIRYFTKTKPNVVSRKSQSNLSKTKEKVSVAGSKDLARAAKHGIGKQEINEQGRIRHFCKCGKNYTAGHWLKDHILGDSLEKHFGCEMCPKRFHFHSQLKVHMIHHHKMGYTNYASEGKIFACSKCAELFPTMKLLWEHKKVTHKQ